FWGRPRFTAPLLTAFAVRCGGLLSVLALMGCEPGIFPSKGAVGKGDTTILIDSLAILLAIVVPTIVVVRKASSGANITAGRITTAPGNAACATFTRLRYATRKQTALDLGQQPLCSAVFACRTDLSARFRLYSSD